jgi:hypothetical protein
MEAGAEVGMVEDVQWWTINGTVRSTEHISTFDSNLTTAKHTLLALITLSG